MSEIINNTNEILNSDKSIDNSMVDTVTNSDNAVNNITTYKGMGKGSNPNSKKQLVSLADRTLEERQAIGRKGGLKNGEKLRARKTMKETILAMLSQEITPKQMEQYGLDKTMLNGDNTMQGAIIASMLREALNGSEKAALLLRDTMGEAPINRSEVVQEVITKEDTDMMKDLRDSLISKVM